MLFSAVSAPSSKTLFCKAWYVTEWSRRRIAIATGREDSFIFRRGENVPPFSEIGDTDARVCVCVTSALHHDEVHTRKRWMMVGRSGRKLDLAKVKKREDILSPLHPRILAVKLIHFLQ